VRPDLRHFALALAAAALVHVGGAAALLSGADAGDGPGRGGDPGRGGTGGRGLRFSLGHVGDGGRAPKGDATTLGSPMDLARSEQLATAAPPIPHDTAMATAPEESARDLGHMLSGPPHVSAPPPEDDRVRLARASVSDTAIQGESAPPQSPAAERGKGSSGVEGGSEQAVGLGIAGGGLADDGDGNGGGGGGAGSGLLSSAEGRDYYFGVSQKVSRNLRYPSRAQREGLEGRVLVSVRIDRKGELLECELGESSGARHLDRDALRTVKRAAPFGAVPGSIEGRGLEFDVPVVYGLD
jgi:TonB family protein